MSAKRKNSSTTANAVLLLGEPLLTDPAARKHIDGHLGTAAQDLDLEILRMPEHPLTEAIAALRQVGMFSQGRCVWIRGMVAEPASEVDALLEFLQNGLPAQTMLVASAPRLDKRSRLYKWFAAEALVVDLAPATERSGRIAPAEASHLASERIRAGGLPLPPGAVLEAIAKRAGANVGEFLNEVDRLCLVASTGKPLDVAMVRAHMKDQAATWVYDFTDAIGARRAGEAERLLEGLLAQGEPPLRLLALLSSYIADLVEASRFLPALSRQSFASGSAGRFARSDYPSLPAQARKRWSPYRAFYVLRAAAAFAPGHLETLHGRLARLDVMLKSSRTNPLYLFSGFVQEACLRA